MIFLLAQLKKFLINIMSGEQKLLAMKKEKK